MNKVINKFLLTGGKFVQITFKTARIYLYCLRTITKHRDRIQKFRETRNLKHLYRNDLKKVSKYGL